MTFSPEMHQALRESMQDCLSMLVPIRKTSHVFILFLVIAVLVIKGVSFPVCAQEAPISGLLYNTQESSSLSYRCEPAHADELICEFVHTAVRLKSTHEQQSSVVDQARRSFRSEKPPSTKECETHREMMAIFEGKKVAPKQQEFTSLSQVERTDLERLTKAFVEYCDEPTEEHFIALIRIGHDRDRRTCKVTSTLSRQTFRRVPKSDKQTVWISQSDTAGRCGIVELSRFEPDETSQYKSTFTNWKFIARKAITNPSGEFLPGLMCGKLDERPYIYNWLPEERQVSCDYIEFSPF